MKKKSERVPSKSAEVSRREFGRRVAFTVAGSALAATSVSALAEALAGALPVSSLLQEQAESALPAEAQAEVEAKLQHVLAQYGHLLSEDQKKLMRRTVTSHVRMLEAIRPIPVANSDAPATVLQLVDDETAGPDLSPATRIRRKKTASPKREE
ncbi:MAG: hypothetical protein ACYDCM_10310 [Candidatus Acidiferrales bacterium]